MSSFNFNVLESNVYNKTKVSVIQVTNLKPNKNINIKEMANIYKTMQYKLYKDNKKGKILIRGLSPNGWIHLKSYNQELDEIEGGLEEYYSNRVATENKFHEFGQLQFYIATSTTNSKDIEIPKKPKKVVKNMFIK